jgi:hypothetical protein
MEKQENDQSSQEEKNQDLWTVEDGLRFLKELREMPYDTSKVGQVFVTTSIGQKPKIHGTEGGKR